MQRTCVGDTASDLAGIGRTRCRPGVPFQSSARLPRLSTTQGSCVSRQGQGGCWPVPVSLLLSV